jgi:hypothetical protein
VLENMYGLRENPHKNAAEKAEKETRQYLQTKILHAELQRLFSLPFLRFLPVM